MANIRELRNVLERAKLLARGEEIQPKHIDNTLAKEVVPAFPSRWNLEEIEDEIILKAVEHFGAKNRAAEELGLSISSLYRKLEKIQKPSTLV